MSSTTTTIPFTHRFGDPTVGFYSYSRCFLV